MPYWDITLTKYKQGYGENDKTLMKEIKEGLGNWRDSQCSLIGKHNIVKMSILLNFVYSFPSQNHSKTFCEYWWTDSEVYTKRRETQSSQHNTEGEWKSGQTNTTRLKTHCKATVMQEKKKEKRPQLSRCRVAEEQTHRSMKVKENAKTSPYKYIQLISDKGAKAALCKEDGLMKIWCWNNRESI